MWLNIVLMILASLILGFILGVIMARPRRWDTYVCDGHEHPRLARR